MYSSFQLAKAETNSNSKFLYIKKQVQKILKMMFYYSCWWISFLKIQFQPLQSCHVLASMPQYHTFGRQEAPILEWAYPRLCEGKNCYYYFISNYPSTGFIFTYLSLHTYPNIHWQQVKTHNKYLLLSVNKL